MRGDKTYKITSINGDFSVEVPNLQLQNAVTVIRLTLYPVSEVAKHRFGRMHIIYYYTH